MATIGMDRLFYAPITEDLNGEETYGVPVQMAKAINADLTITLSEATLHADDGLAYVIKDFNSGTLVLGVDDLKVAVVQALTGAEVDDNGVLVSASEDIGAPVAIGFRAAKPNGDYRYFWFYRVKFGFLPQICRPRAIPSPSRPRLSRERFSDETGWMSAATIRGKRRLWIRKQAAMLSKTGTPKCMNLRLQAAAVKKKNRRLNKNLSLCG